MSHNLKVARRALATALAWIGMALPLCVIPLLPRRGLFVLCDFLSWVMYLLDRRGKRRALENLRIIRGTCTGLEGTPAYKPERASYKPTAAEARIVRRSYRNMARSVGYAFWTVFRAKSRCRAMGEMSEATRRFLAANKPTIAVSAHLGCWEILSQLAFLEGHGMMSVAKKTRIAGVMSLLMRARRAIGQEIVPANGALRALMQGLRAGKSLGLLVDQRVSIKKGGLVIRFFGRPMPVSAAPAFFSAKSKAPIIVAWSRPLKDCRYRCEMIGTHTAAEARDIWGLTQTIADELASAIRRHPSCWILNYDYFCNLLGPQDIAKLAEREAARDARRT